MHHPFSATRPTRVAAAIATSLAISAAAALGGATYSAVADTRPVLSGTPVTASADVLPTAQMNGVAKTQVIIGDTVYVGGEFTKARPAGAAAGTSESTRTNLMAYNVKTGVMTSFAPTLDGKVVALAASPDGKTLYVGGAFTKINGAARYRAASFNVADGSLTSWAPVMASDVHAIAATDTAVYLGGYSKTVNGTTRPNIAAVDARTAAVLPFAPNVNGPVEGITVSPDRTKVVIVGGFITVNGNDSFGTYGGLGMAILDVATSKSLPLKANQVIRDGGSGSGLTSVVAGGAATADGFYVTGYDYSADTGNFEGAARIGWDGSLMWMEDCHGDTYSAWPAGDQIYTASHAHTCANVPSGFPETTPRTNHHGLAFTTAKAGTLTKNQSGGNYSDFAGQAAPALLHWFPDFTIGTFTGQSQAAWTVTGNADYVVYGGEFPAVNGVAQQGMVRFPRTSAPNHAGPRLTGTGWTTPTATVTKGAIRVEWPADDDRDNARLTYDVLRDGKVVATQSANSTWWSHPSLSYLDTAVVSGSAYRYQIKVSDPFGNSTISGVTTATASDAAPALTAYEKTVLADNPSLLWTLNERSGATTADQSGHSNTGTKTSKVSMGASAASTAQGKAFKFPGSDDQTLASGGDAVKAPQVFTVEAWVKTTTTKAGKVIGFGSATSGDSKSNDRHLYLDNSGKAYFGVYPSKYVTLKSPKAVNDGKWHHLAGTLSPAGMVLYVDGKAVATNTTTTKAAEKTVGWWRVGGDRIGSGWAGSTSSGYLSGTIDNAAVYGSALSSAQVAAHYQNGR